MEPAWWFLQLGDRLPLYFKITVCIPLVFGYRHPWLLPSNPWCREHRRSESRTDLLHTRGNNSHRRLERHLSKESLFGFLSGLTKSDPVQSSVAQLGLRGATTYETTSLLLVQLKPLVSAHDSERWVWLMAQQPQLVAEGVTPGTYRDLNASPAFHATEPAPPDQLSFCWGGQRGERPTLVVLKAPTYALSERCSMMFLCLARTQGTGVVVLILHRMKRYFELPGGGGGGARWTTALASKATSDPRRSLL
jgi:hypothetical protein